MTLRDEGLPIRQMLDHDREALDMVRDRTQADVRANRMLQLALVKLVEAVGEAASRVSPDIRRRHPEIPWRQTITTWNRLNREYDTVDYGIIWDTIAQGFPALVAALDRVRGSRGGEDNSRETASAGAMAQKHARIEVPRERIADFCRRHHIRRLSFFGSVLRDDFTPNSDVDVLVEFEPGETPGLAFFRMQDGLSEILGWRVDLNTPKDLSPYFRERVLQSAEPVYGAA